MLPITFSLGSLAEALFSSEVMTLFFNINPQCLQEVMTFLPHHCGVLVFFGCIPPGRPLPRPRPPPRLSHLKELIPHITSHPQLISFIAYTTHLKPPISHYSSHTSHLTHNSSHATHLLHLSHNSSHPQLISFISHTTHLTQLTSFIYHTTHLIHNSSPSSHTQLISHNSSHTTHLTTFIISHNSSHPSNSSPTTHLARQAPYTEAPAGAAARIVAAVSASTCCVAGAVHRAS